MGLLSAISGIIGGGKQAKAARYAADLQSQAAQQGIAEQRRQFDVTRADFAPYQALGVAGVQQYGNLSGINGEMAQADALAGIRESPFYQSLYRAGEDAVLANASATGGLRGGNTQSSLYRLGEDTLSSSIDRQLAMYSGAIGVGQGAAGTVGAFGANSVAQQNALRGAGADAMGQSRLVGAGIGAQNWANIGSSIQGALGRSPTGGITFDWGKLF